MKHRCKLTGKRNAGDGCEPGVIVVCPANGELGVIGQNGKGFYVRLFDGGIWHPHKLNVDTQSLEYDLQMLLDLWRPVNVARWETTVHTG